MIKRIVFDGNDGTGKTTRLEEMKKLFRNIEYTDRGIFSQMTLVDELFNDMENTECLRQKFHDLIKNDSETLYIICRCSPKTCQERIKLRGDSIEEEFHTMDDLTKYDNRFNMLVGLVSELPNVMYVET